MAANVTTRVTAVILPAETTVSFAPEFKDVRPEDIFMFAFPTQGTGRSGDGQSIVLADPLTTERLADATSRRHNVPSSPRRQTFGKATDFG